MCDPEAYVHAMLTPFFLSFFLSFVVSTAACFCLPHHACKYQAISIKTRGEGREEEA
jgi:hypothetical protein